LLFVPTSLALLMVYLYALTRLPLPDKPVFGSTTGRLISAYFLPVLIAVLTGMAFRLWRGELRYRIFAALFCIVAPAVAFLLFLYISCVMSYCL